jgi:hypothetical protein
MDRFNLKRFPSGRKCWLVMLTCFLLLVPASRVAAQVEIIAEPGIERLMKNRVNERILNGGKVPGYRVLVAYSNSRGAAGIQTEDARRAFAGRYEVLQIYDEPNFKVYVGAFRYRWEAELALQEIQKKYRGARVVQDEIRLPAP